MKSEFDNVFIDLYYYFFVPVIMTMMMACFAKGCHQKDVETEVQDVSKWRPCMGCRSHWIHVQCGGFCSDCQANNASPIEAMKTTFCSQIKTTKKSRASDRSPLSIKQSQIAKRLESSSGKITYVKSYCKCYFGEISFMITKP